MPFSRKPQAPSYTTPEGFRCPDCNEECHIIPLFNEFDYGGTHCTHGKGGTEYPSDWGSPISDCCEACCTEALSDAQEAFEWEQELNSSYNQDRI